jgi:hypothetical protein
LAAWRFQGQAIYEILVILPELTLVVLDSVKVGVGLGLTRGSSKVRVRTLADITRD